MPNSGMLSPESGMQREPRFSSSTSKISRTGVEIPASEKVWAVKLVEAFKGIDPKYQRQITDLIGSFQQEDPTKAAEIARQIGQFFNDFGDPGKPYIDLPTFLETLEDQVKNRKPELIN